MSRTAKEIETTGLPCEAQNGETIQVVPKINVTMFGKFTLHPQIRRKSYDEQAIPRTACWICNPNATKHGDEP